MALRADSPDGLAVTSSKESVCAGRAMIAVKTNLPGMETIIGYVFLRPDRAPLARPL